MLVPHAEGMYADVMDFKGKFQKQLFTNATQQIQDVILLTSLITSL